MKTRALSLLLTIAIFTSLTFEAFHTGHEAACHEENCPVCHSDKERQIELKDGELPPREEGTFVTVSD